MYVRDHLTPTNKLPNTSIMVDYVLFRYPEMLSRQSTTSQNVVTALKLIIHNIPETVNDNGSKYSSEEFTEFAQKYQFTHVTSSPHYTSSSGLAERTVQITTFSQECTIFGSIVLLFYCISHGVENHQWGTPNGQISKTHCLWQRATLPLSGPTSHWLGRTTRSLKRNKRDHDQQHQVRRLPPIPDYTHVWVTSGSSPVPGTTVTSTDTP